MKMNVDRYPVVEVKWLDSSGGARWGDLAEVDHERMICRSVGWLIHSCPKCIEVAPHFSNLQEDPISVSGEMAIPRVAIIRLRTIKMKERKKMAKKKVVKKSVKRVKTARRRPVRKEKVTETEQETEFIGGESEGED